MLGATSTPLQSSLPVTELNNELTKDLDATDGASSFLRHLRNTDAQIFSGYRGYSSLYDPTCVRACERVHWGEQDVRGGPRDGLEGVGDDGVMWRVRVRRGEVMIEESREGRRIIFYQVRYPVYCIN